MITIVRSLGRLFDYFGFNLIWMILIPCIAVFLMRIIMKKLHLVDTSDQSFNENLVDRLDNSSDREKRKVNPFDQKSFLKKD